MARERLNDLERRAGLALRQRLLGARRMFEARAQLLGTLGLQGVLERGFALVRDGAGKGVRSAAHLAPGDAVSIQFSDGQVGATVGEGGQSPAADEKTSKRAKSPKGSGPQGSLF